MVYKEGPPYRQRPVLEIIEDMEEAAATYGQRFTTLFFPAGNTIAMKTKHLAQICRHARKLFPKLTRITVYGSFQYIVQKGFEELIELQQAGLSRIHVGLETGDDETLKKIRKGTTRLQQIQGGKWIMEAGIELSLYVLLGIAGTKRSKQHALATAEVLNAIQPTFIRLRTFLPKVKTPILKEIEEGSFDIAGPHQILEELKLLITHLHCSSQLTSDHYTNYLNLHGTLPGDKQSMLSLIDTYLQKDETSFRPIYLGSQ
jgi:radical SAM superfamily enzyme YgiQ (UPF0313 family)